MNRLNKSESAIFVSLVCSLLPEDLHSELILSSSHLALCRLPVQHHSEYYILLSFGIIGLILCKFENRVPLKPVLGCSGQCSTITLLHIYILLFFYFFDVFLASIGSSSRTYLIGFDHYFFSIDE